MQKKDFSFTLPDSLIAQKPCDKRTDSRLLHINRKTSQIKDRLFTDILDLLQPGDLLVMNNTRVIPARLFGKKETGGAVEVLIERLLDEKRAMAFVRASKSPKVGSTIHFANDVTATVSGRDDGLFELAFNIDSDLLGVLEALGEIPLPPYMHRDATEYDKNRYQTVFAEHPGAVAAPTAGLHFDEDILSKIKAKGIDFSYVTLHVGAGTFQPIRVDNILEHKMHKERIDVSAETCQKINETRKNGGRIVAVGTTVVRSLESAAREGLSEQDEILPFSGETDIFIYPGYQFQMIDALVTNFHLPESTLLMLVSAFASHSQIQQAYQHAIDEKYRFYSYGDAMFID
ncbi:MAG TPA: tRNA preQ1(34) S-adenosylmethionine ribosyltransferase-isomerase QueA [Gammaproteobacteria bacterium]|nr:tRNA preQ1(34) S-adenosylmethionine ribosyltransferase-isomerase QueA [Gammaproteobacteria bacterium]